MALSKPAFVKFDENVSEKVSKIFNEDYKGSLNPEEIVTFCKITQERPVSVNVIKHYFGGEEMDYPVMDLSNSHECYQFCHGNMLKILQETKCNIEFFEDRSSTDANIIVAVLRKPKKNSKGEHVSVMAVIHFTLFNTPKVGFCRYFDLNGMHVLYNFMETNN